MGLHLAKQMEIDDIQMMIEISDVIDIDTSERAGYVAGIIDAWEHRLEV